MVYPRHWLLRFEGDFNAIGGSTHRETWSCGIRCLAPEFPVDEDAILQAHAGDWMRMLVANSFTSQIVQGTMVKLNEIGPDGKYADDTVTHLIEDQDWGGGTAVGGHTAIVEPQRTLAVSWTTGYRRGRAHRGRIYLPAYASPVNGQLEITNANNVITMAKNLMDGIQATAVLEPAVVSGLGAGTARVITGIEIGSRVDTQRRRRAQLPEYYAVGLA